MQVRLLLIFFITVCQVVKGQSITARYDSLFNYLKAKDDFNGNVLIADRGKIVYQKSIGYAAFENKSLLNKNTMFNLASISKQFTAMGIMILIEQNKLSLDSKLDSFIPQLSFYKNISIKNLLTHTSGLPDYEELFAQHWDRSKVAHNKNVIELLAQYKPPVHFNAGENWEYSNTGYALLASIIEKVSGLSYAEFLEKNIFHPLHMTRTRVYTTRISDHQKIYNQALGYLINDKTGHPISQDSVKEREYVKYLDGIAGDGAVYSTVIDLLKWDRALYSTKLVTNRSLKQMFTPAILKNGNSTGYGFGWGIVTERPKTGKYVGHNGSWGGFDTHIDRFIDYDKTIIVLRNIQNQNNVSGVYDAYIDILFNNAFKLPVITKN
ncbi:beta-lactamase family protein [Mucilaginibacter sp. UR6-1]|uniref:serine hydrolase domain-containing protein n=1 Tax=Mucilaginibacter sp. UR6-1 TaxID=1435643 RepID=UPI001E614532|nr:serine hydrolase [Mucilaginibacter sp. UR6-1]MCC8410716.1 beta-lactamase family protein [Mucilaginibacter sp. UR6-1]